MPRDPAREQLLDNHRNGPNLSLWPTNGRDGNCFYDVISQKSLDYPLEGVHDQIMGSVCSIATLVLDYGIA